MNSPLSANEILNVSLALKETAPILEKLSHIESYTLLRLLEECRRKALEITPIPQEEIDKAEQYIKTTPVL